MNLASKIIQFLLESYVEYSALTGACSWPFIKDALDAFVRVTLSRISQMSTRFMKAVTHFHHHCYGACDAMPEMPTLPLIIHLPQFLAPSAFHFVVRSW